MISLGWRTHSLFLCIAISLVIQIHEISLHKHNSCVLPRLIKHSLVLVIIVCGNIKIALKPRLPVRLQAGHWVKDNTYKHLHKYI